MKRLFSGGIHPYSKKESTRKKAISHPVFPPSQLVLPLYSAREDILEPIVAEGEEVKIGQKIAIAEEGSALPLFTGISGTVKKIGLESHPYFGKTPAVVIANDFKNNKITLHPCENPIALTSEQVMEQLSRLGVRDMSLEEEPVSEKIRGHLGRVHTLILNAVECEPYLTADYRLLLDRLDMVMKGSRLLYQALQVETLVFAVQGDKMDAIEALEQHPLWDETYMKLSIIPTRYPFGEEKQVIRLVTGVELGKNTPSTEANCVVFQVGTAHAVGEAIYNGQAQTHRVVTVSGGAVKRPRNLWLPIGAPLESLFVNGEGMKEEPSMILMGGPLTGLVQKDLRAPLLVSSAGLLALAKWEVPPHLQEDSPASAMPCMRCGHCLPVCPIHLMPHMVYRHMQKPYQNPKILSKFHPEACIGCGACNYRCPSRLPLVQNMAEAELLVAEYRGQLEAEKLANSLESTGISPISTPIEGEEVMILVDESQSEQEDLSLEPQEALREVPPEQKSGEEEKIGEMDEKPPLPAEKPVSEQDSEGKPPLEEDEVLLIVVDPPDVQDDEKGVLG